MKTIKKYTFILFAVLAGAVSQSCQENIDMSDRYTFQQETLASYLQKHEVYSDYYRCLGQVSVSKKSKSTVLQLISSRGHYTVFAPTNDAIQEYLDTLWKQNIIDEPSWDGFRNQKDMDSIMKVIVHNSIIDSGDDATDVGIYTSSFPKDTEEFGRPNLNERRLTLAIDKENNYYINGLKDKDKNVISGSLLDERNRDIPAINGVLHQVHSVIAPSNQKMSDLMAEIIEKSEEFTGMAKLITICGVHKELSKDRDLVYEDLILTEQVQDLTTDKVLFENNQVPDHRDYGFTIFAERDEFWQENLGADPKAVSQEEFARLVKDWVVQKGFYPNAKDDEDYEKPENVLYQFVTYHILPARMSRDKLVIHHSEKGFDMNNMDRLTIPVYDYQTTIGQRRLLKLYESKESDGIYLNRFPILNNERDGDYHENRCDASKLGFKVLAEGMRNVINGYIYPIEPADGATGPATLAYDQTTRENLQKERIRFDVSSMFPEFLNNNIKMIKAPRGGSQGNWGFPIDADYKYLDNLSIEAGTNFCYLPGVGYAWYNYQGDEFNVQGSYDMTFTMPPVPMKSTYEIRFSIQANSGSRGMCQVYFGTNPDRLPAMGIPLDMRLRGNKAVTGWEEDTSDPDYNANIDKKMRNLGYMKGPEYFNPGRNTNTTARKEGDLTRRIIVRQELDPDETYYLKFKSVLEDTKKEFVVDYFEICAKEVYDNENNPEDIW